MRELRSFAFFPARVVLIPRRSGEYLSVGPTLSAGAPVVAWSGRHSEGELGRVSLFPGDGVGSRQETDLGEKHKARLSSHQVLQSRKVILSSVLKEVELVRNTRAN